MEQIRFFLAKYFGLSPSILRAMPETDILAMHNATRDMFSAQ